MLKRVTGMVAVAALTGWISPASALPFLDAGVVTAQNVDDFFSLTFDVRVEDVFQLPEES